MTVFANQIEKKKTKRVISIKKFNQNNQFNFKFFLNKCYFLIF